MEVCIRTGGGTPPVRGVAKYLPWDRSKTFPGIGQIEGVPGVRKNFDPEGRGLCVFLGGYVAISCCKLGEGAVGGQDVFII